MAADDCPGRDALNRLVELRSDHELFLDEESFRVGRAYIFRDLVSLPRTSLKAKIILAAILAASLTAAAYGVVMLAEWFLSFGLTGLLISFAAYRGRKRELAACRGFTCEERLAIIDEIEAAGRVSTEEAIDLRGGVEKLARDAPETAAPWDRAAAAQQAARDAADQAQIAASRASRWSGALERCGAYFWNYFWPVIVVTIVSSAVAYAAGFTMIAKILFLAPFMYPALLLFGSGVWMVLQAYLTFHMRLALGELASAWSGLILLSILGISFFYLAVAIFRGCLEVSLS